MSNPTAIEFGTDAALNCLCFSKDWRELAHRPEAPISPLRDSRRRESLADILREDTHWRLTLDEVCDWAERVSPGSFQAHLQAAELHRVTALAVHRAMVNAYYRSGRIEVFERAFQRGGVSAVWTDATWHAVLE